MAAGETMTLRGYRDLKVWQKSMDLVDEIYRIAKTFPREEMYGLRSQITRAAVSVPANIAEGSGRGTSKDFANFLSDGRASLMEIETLLLVAVRQGYIQERQASTAFSMMTEIGKMVTGLRFSMRRKMTDA